MPVGCDLIYFNYFPWGAVKEKCYADKPQTIEYLKTNICNAISDIQLQTLEKLYGNYSNRIEYCEVNRGSHMNEIIFPC